MAANDDSKGGPESMVVAELEHEGCTVELKIGWLTGLQNRYRIEGTKATAEGGIEEWGAIHLTHANGNTETVRVRAKEESYTDFGVPIMTSFVQMLRGQGPPPVPVDEVLGSIHLLDGLYAQARPLDLPWKYTGGVR